MVNLDQAYSGHFFLTAFLLICSVALAGLILGLAKYVYHDNCQSNLHTGTGFLLDAAHIYDELAPLTNQTNKQALGSSALLVFGFYSREGVYRYTYINTYIHTY